MNRLSEFLGQSIGIEAWIASMLAGSFDNRTAIRSPAPGSRSAIRAAPAASSANDRGTASAV